MSKQDKSKQQSAQPQPGKNGPKGKRPPALVEISMTVSKGILVITAAVVAGVSIYSGCNVANIVIRTGGTLLGLGFLLWIINWLIAKGVIDAEIERMKEESQPASTREIKA